MENKSPEAEMPQEVETQSLTSVADAVAVFSEWHSQKCTEVYHMANLPPEHGIEIELVNPQTGVLAPVPLTTEQEMKGYQVGMLFALSIFEHTPFHVVVESTTDEENA